MARFPLAPPLRTALPALTLAFAVAGSGLLPPAAAAGQLGLVARLHAESPTQFEHLGYCVDVDGTTIVIAGSGNQGVGVAGAAHLFELDPEGLWTETAILSTLPIDDFFGLAAALSTPFLAVGAPGDDEQGSEAGAVYLYHDQGEWQLVDKLLAADGDGGRWFGSSVAFDGTTLVVGAPEVGSDGTSPGLVYVFEPDGTGVWQQVDRLEPTGFQVHRFGRSVAIDGDTILVGAPEDVRGSADVYARTAPGAGWAELQRLTPTDQNNHQRFGESVAIEGDLLLVGAPNDNLPADSGAAYLFRFDSGSGLWQQAHKLKPADLAIGDEVGGTVAFDGSTALLGAHNSAKRLVYRYERDPGAPDQWREVPSLKPLREDAWTFGYGLAVEGDLALVGTPGDDSDLTGSGAAYLFAPPWFGDDFESGDLSAWSQVFP